MIIYCNKCKIPLEDWNGFTLYKCKNCKFEVYEVSEW